MIQNIPRLIIWSPDHVGLHGADHGPGGQKLLCFSAWAQGLYMASPGIPTAVGGKGPGPSTNPSALQVSEDAPKCFYLPGSFFPMFLQNLSTRALPTSQKNLGGGPQVAMWLLGHTKATNSPYLCERWRQPRL